MLAVKVIAGVVDPLATEVVKRGEKLPAVTAVTVPVPPDVILRVNAFVFEVESSVHPDPQIIVLNPGICGEYILNPVPIFGGIVAMPPLAGAQYAYPAAESNVNTEPSGKLVKFKGICAIVSALQLRQEPPPPE